jgi:hypothetical protein
LSPFFGFLYVRYFALAIVFNQILNWPECRLGQLGELAPQLTQGLNVAVVFDGTKTNLEGRGIKRAAREKQISQTRSE